MMKCYKLVGTEVVEAEDMEEVFSAPNRQLFDEYIGKFRISTVFLVLDHRYGDEGDPIVFETMVFHEDLTLGEELYCDRYSSYLEAMKGHERAVNLVKEGKLSEHV